MTIIKTTEVTLTDDELAHIKGTLNIIDEICESQNGECSACPLLATCRNVADHANVRSAIFHMYQDLGRVKKS